MDDLLGDLMEAAAELRTADPGLLHDLCRWLTRIADVLSPDELVAMAVDLILDKVLPENVPKEVKAILSRLLSKLIEKSVSAALPGVDLITMLRVLALLLCPEPVRCSFATKNMAKIGKFAISPDEAH